MKEGTRIYCHDEDEFIRTLEELSCAGYGAVRDSNYDGYTIVITSVPEDDQ